ETYSNNAMTRRKPMKRAINIIFTAAIILGGVQVLAYLGTGANDALNTIQDEGRRMMVELESEGVCNTPWLTSSCAASTIWSVVMRCRLPTTHLASVRW